MTIWDSLEIRYGPNFRVNKENQQEFNDLFHQLKSDCISKKAISSKRVSKLFDFLVDVDAENLEKAEKFKSERHNVTFEEVYTRFEKSKGYNFSYERKIEMPIGLVMKNKKGSESYYPSFTRQYTFREMLAFLLFDLCDIKFNDKEEAVYYVYNWIETYLSNNHAPKHILVKSNEQKFYRKYTVAGFVTHKFVFPLITEKHGKDSNERYFQAVSYIMKKRQK